MSNEPREPIDQTHLRLSKDPKEFGSCYRPTEKECDDEACDQSRSNLVEKCEPKGIWKFFVQQARVRIEGRGKRYQFGAKHEEQEYPSWHPPCHGYSGWKQNIVAGAASFIHKDNANRSLATAEALDEEQ
jgi:hypothetical protein